MILNLVLFVILVALFLGAIGWANGHHEKARRTPGYCPVCDKRMNRSEQ